MKTTAITVEGAIAQVLFRSGCKPDISIDIHGYITRGYGYLDHNGFWEFSLPDGEDVENHVESGSYQPTLF